MRRACGAFFVTAARRIRCEARATHISRRTVRYAEKYAWAPVTTQMVRIAAVTKSRQRSFLWPTTRHDY